MKTRSMPRKGRGTLHIIAGLLMASALVRIGGHTGAALANEGSEEEGITASSLSSVTMQTDALLAAFQAREARLAEREAQLRDRMETLRSAEMEIDEKLAALRSAEESLRTTIAQADSAASHDLAQLASVYQNMKPKDAAALFEEMPPQFAAGFLGMMQADAAARIMTELAPETAFSFSVVLAGRNANVPTR
ncbi:hypothetical protein [Yoonia sp.]|uniref:MotE family protein n=1 Tax=Yoonia sp. TaxID=2212373 RepID=UPI0019FE16CD|nr:hypothetical protein [Yoonia sp.]MBE0413793.1 hypothetical protein [Yoonia sp.]